MRLTGNYMGVQEMRLMPLEDACICGGGGGVQERSDRRSRTEQDTQKD